MFAARFSRESTGRAARLHWSNHQIGRAALRATSCGKIRTVKLIERLRLTSTTSWVVISLIAVLAWGTFDPFGIRQRLDWIVQDQFLKRRAPAEIHPDLLQVSLDDYAAAQFGKNDQRHRMARALRQLDSGLRVEADP